MNQKKKKIDCFTQLKELAVIEIPILNLSKKKEIIFS